MNIFKDGDRVILKFFGGTFRAKVIMVSDECVTIIDDDGVTLSISDLRKIERDISYYREERLNGLLDS